jgi:SAM-dependent methyltransferase
MSEDTSLAAVLDRAWRDTSAIDAAHERGELDDAGWHRAVAARIVPAYLAATDERGGSGHTGTAEDWEYSRGIVGEAIARSGTFLDIGCANGLLMESVVRWGNARNLGIEAYGLDISPELAERARGRLPAHADRVFVGNALGWMPPRRFDVVRTGLEYVPPRRRPDLVAWLLDRVVAPRGRLVIGKYNELVAECATEAALARWGFNVAGRIERPHRSEPRACYRVVWID